MTEESLFREALARPDPDERAAFLDAACAGRPQLRAAVEALLAAHAAATTAPAESSQEFTGDFTEREPPAAADPSPIAAGTVIAGRYVLVRKIGEGGMGEVWVADQTEPVKRQVALKLIKAGMDTKAVLRRFEQERQALALMDHPNIARVFDGGMTAHHRPFFVMELVNGKPLTQFCDEAKLTPRQRLELYVPVCQAVQHAHQKGIIHRDLKPSNILVTLYDGKPVPKVIDFGVAKATGQQLIDESIVTQFGAVIGTLEYMAPEQGGYSALDIDTRADIYSLGVILYELLTGLRPFDAKRLRRAALDELIRAIREEEPSRPSARLTGDEALASAAAARQTQPKKLMALMRGELDWIVMKCLEKERSRRYETADALARDIQHYLADEPVEARPPSFGYRLRKLLSRHKAAALAAAAVLLALVVSVAVSSTAAVLIWQEQKRTEAERTKAAETADAAIGVVRDLNTYVESYEAGSGYAAVSEAQRKDRLKTALASYERLLKLHPEDKLLRMNVARMHHLNANLSRSLDRTAEAENSYSESIRLYRQLADDYPDEPRYRQDTALVMFDFAGQLEHLGRYQEASRILGDSIDLYEGLVAAKPDEPNYQRNLANMLINRSDWDFQLGHLADSERAARRAAELYTRLADTPGTRPEPVDPLLHAIAEHNLAMTLRKEGRIDDALAAHDRAVERMAGLTKATNSRDAWSLYYRTRTERAWTTGRVPGRAPAAVAELESAVAGWDKLIKQLGPNPIDLERKAVAGLYCGRLNAQLGRRDAAVKDLSAAATVLQGLVGKQPAVPAYRYDLGRTYTALGQLTGDSREAAGWYGKARQMLEAALKQYPENANYGQALKDLNALTGAKP